MMKKKKQCGSISHVRVWVGRKDGDQRSDITPQNSLSQQCHLVYFCQILSRSSRLTEKTHKHFSAPHNSKLASGIVGPQIVRSLVSQKFSRFVEILPLNPEVF